MYICINESQYLYRIRVLNAGSVESDDHGKEEADDGGHLPHGGDVGGVAAGSRLGIRLRKVVLVTEVSVTETVLRRPHILAVLVRIPLWQGDNTLRISQS